MDKRLFSITCTTCQARLVVRSEEAIGAILECPRCQSMVQVTPPPGWQPAAVPVETPVAPGGPPPLDHVASESPSLELEPARSAIWESVVSPTGLVLAGAVLTLVVVVSVLWWMLPTPAAPQPEPVTVEAKTPENEAELPTVKAEATTPADESESKSETPAAAEPPSSATSPETSEKEVAGEPSAPLAATEETPSASSAELPATDEQPEPSSSADGAAEEPGEQAGQVRAGQVRAGQVEIKKAPLEQVDVAARLSDPVARIELDGIALAKAVDLLAAMGNFPVTIDVDALVQRGVSPHEPISVKLEGTTIGKALRAVAAQKGLAVTMENGHVTVTSPAEYREKLQKVRYTVADLTGEDEAAVAELAALVRKLVAPESWESVGGRGTIEPEKTVLVVQQTGEVHQQVLIFCEKLRTARHKPIRSHDNPERFALTTERAKARKMLARPVSVNFHEPTPLGRVLGFLSEAAQVDILVDHAALNAAGTSDRVETTLTVAKQQLGTTLDELLRPLGLAYRTVGDNVIQVTTREAEAERMSLEFYPVGASAASAEGLKTRVAPSTWSDAGGSAEIYFDQASGCLIVLQSQSAQAEIERELGNKAEGGGGKAE